MTVIRLKVKLVLFAFALTFGIVLLVVRSLGQLAPERAIVDAAVKDERTAMQDNAVGGGFADEKEGGGQTDGLQADGGMPKLQGDVEDAVEEEEEADEEAQEGEGTDEGSQQNGFHLPATLAEGVVLDELVQVEGTPRIPERQVSFITEDDVTCHTDGTERREGGTCVCVDGYTGPECAYPRVIESIVVKTPPRRRAKRRRIVDCFLLNIEMDMLEIRLNELESAVDVHVIVEGRKTHNDEPNPLRFVQHLDRFRRFLPKIVHVVVNDVPTGKGKSGWGILDAMRNSIDTGVRVVEDQLEDDDIIMYSDADELVDARVLNFVRDFENIPQHFEVMMRWSYYGFLWRNPRGTLMPMGTTLRNYRDRLGRQGERIRNPPYYKEPGAMVRFGAERVYAGWHCSWCFPVEDFVVKLDSAGSGDGTRWGDFPEKKELAYLKDNKRIGRWFDGSSDGTLVTLAAEPNMAPPYARDRAHDSLAFLFDRDL